MQRYAHIRYRNILNFLLCKLANAFPFSAIIHYTEFQFKWKKNSNMLSLRYGNDTTCMYNLRYVPGIREKTVTIPYLWNSMSQKESKVVIRRYTGASFHIWLFLLLIYPLDPTARWGHKMLAAIAVFITTTPSGRIIIRLYAPFYFVIANDTHPVKFSFQMTTYIFKEFWKCTVLLNLRKPYTDVIKYDCRYWFQTFTRPFWA